MSTPGTGPNWVLYLTGTDAGAPVLVLDADIEVLSGAPWGGGVATGIAYPEGGGFGGSYGVSLISGLPVSPLTGTGVLYFDGRQSGGGGINSGVLDTNQNFLPALVSTDLTAQFFICGSGN